MKRPGHFILCLVVAMGIASLGGAMARAEPLMFIVNRENSIQTLTATQVRDLFLKRQTRWPDGTPVRFIDWKDGFEVRKRFLAAVVGKSSRDVELYWIGQKLYTGDSAPLKVGSDILVIQLVSRLKGAIGYLPEAALPAGFSVKKVEVSGTR